MSDSESMKDDGAEADERIDALAEDFLAELQAGGRPDVAALLAAHSDIAERLGRRLALVERLFRAGQAAVGADGRALPADQARRLNCPHCGNRIQLVEPRPKEVTCVNCGSSFRVEPETTATYRNTGPGGTIGRFQVRELLGRGAFGEVYKARDPELDRVVAVKIPRTETFGTREDEERFVREARSCARLVHPGIVQVHEVARDGDLPYIVSDYVEGLTLADLLTAGRTGFRDSAEILAQLADALDYAHRQGVVHRDVKPSNVLLSRSDDGKYQPHVTDFGLARRDEGEITITLDGQVLGTPAYMSPEQAVGDQRRVDGRSDVYSLGVVLYELLTGELPFRGNKRMLLHQVIHDEPRPPRSLNDKIPRDLETICLKAMAKEPERRFTLAADLADDLRRFLRGDPIHARPVGRAEKAWRWGKRNPALATLAALLLMAMSGGTMVSSYFAILATRTASKLTVEKDRADENLALSQRRLYAGRMNLAQIAWEKVDIARVRELLDAYRNPRPDEPDLRGWEWHYQDRLCNTELRKLFPDDNDRLTRFAFSPDGDRIASVSESGAVRIWEVATGQTLSTLKYPGYSLAYSPDGRRLALAQRHGSILVFDSSAGAQVAELIGHTDRVESIAFSPDSQALVSGSVDGSVRLWDLATGAERNRIERPGDEVQRDVRSVAWSPDGTKFAFAFEVHRRGLMHDESGRAPYWVSYEVHEVAVWDFAPFKEAFGRRGLSGNASFSRDGSRLIACKDFHAEVWDLERQALECSGPQHSSSGVSTVALSPTGAEAVSGGDDSILRVWYPRAFDLDNRICAEKALLRGHTGSVVHAMFSPSGDMIASLGAEGEIRLWDAQETQEDFSLEGDGCYSLAFTADGKRLAAGGSDFTSDGETHNTPLIWDVESRSRVATLASAGYVRSLAYSRDGKYLATVSDPGVVKLCDLGRDTITKSWELSTPDAGNFAVQKVAFDPDATRLVTGDRDGSIKVWDLAADRQTLEFRAHAGAVRCLAFSEDGRHLATGGEDGMAEDLGRQRRCRAHEHPRRQVDCECCRIQLRRAGACDREPRPTVLGRTNRHSPQNLWRTQSSGY